jgi:D-psicose/D-tagatose/L-ribulose 3-epimerase
MHFGCCVSPEQIEIVAKSGFDYCELPTRAVMPFVDDTAALPALRVLEAAPLRAEAFNLLVPPQLRMVGPEANIAVLRDYLRRAFLRMVQVGGTVVVLGSGAARAIPDGLPRDRALDQLADVLAMAADEAAHAGIDLALEHLNRSESNVFTSVQECRSFIEERGLVGLRLLADLHHLELEHEPLEAVAMAAALLVHVHVADGGRRAPGNGGYDYDGFMETLRRIGYDRRISVECKWEDLQGEAPRALQYMRKRWEAVAG